MIEDKIQNAIKPIIIAYIKMEMNIIEALAEHFNLNEEFINIDYWYLQKLKEIGGFNKKTLKILSEYTGKTQREILNAIKKIGFEAMPTKQLNIAKEKELLDPNKIIESKAIKNIINFSYNEIDNTFLQLNKTIEKTVKKLYTDIVTDTYIKVNSGIYSYQEALLDSLNNLGNKGISILQYQNKNGDIRNYDVVGTVRRDILTATRGLVGKVNKQVIKESGNHVVRVSNHFGARVTDKKNFTNHAWWQEIQYFCWNYDEKATEKEKKLPDFMKNCNYGDVQGILGINCKHYFTVWYGPLEKETDYNYDENEEQYKKTQKQRYLEENIRKWKRKQILAKQIEDKEGYEKASKKAREWQDRLIEFTEENDLKRDYTREHIESYKNVTIKDKSDIILLPNYEKAIIPEEKFTKYALDINNPKGKDKAIAFEKALGYNINNSDKLIENIKNNINKFNVVEKPDKGYGKRYEILMTLKGENNKIANVKTGWIIDKDTKETRLTSAYVTSKKWKEGNK